MTGGRSVIWKRTLERSLDLFDSVSLDNVTYLDVIVTLDIETAVLTQCHFLDIILESLEGSELTCVDHDTVADHAHFGSSLDLTIADNTSRDCSHL